MSVSDWVVIVLIGMCGWPFRKDGRLCLKLLLCSTFIVPLATLGVLQEFIEQEEVNKKNH
ncbi:hypothetical protein [Vibrio metschnikovii]|uniref:hypothetical protein n=1 Tax=Vibrio metschnikovii TaxID=28172 RepID=UPI001C3101C7|nr:hypothetical protein [Vibrio metschnikovii]